MKAAIVREFGRPPQYGVFDEPTVQAGETLVSVRASAVTPLVRGRAAGRHYTSSTPPPFVAGVDGVGTTPEGRRVYFLFVRPPFGGFAERAPVRTDQLIPVPDGLDDAAAAGAAISGMSAWLPLTGFAPIPPGESVLVNGATGNAGRMAIQIAKHLGAAQVVATARTAARAPELRAVGADVVIPLDQPADAFREALRTATRDAKVGVVLDYLWGPPAEAVLDAIAGPDAPRGPERIRFVQIGSLAGPTISLVSAKLRSSGVEVLGSGIGSASNAQIGTGIGEFLQAAASAKFRVEVAPHPIADVERVWGLPDTDRRLVLTLP
jgi:NADPH:quinone reductase-like Zn-dependent oxidoreductase